MNTANEHTGAGLGAGYPAANGQQPPPALVERWYQRLADNSPDGIVVFDGDRVVYVNPAGVRGIGAHSTDELLGRRIIEFVHPDSIPAMLACFAVLRHDGDTTTPAEMVLLRVDGTLLDVEVVTVMTVWEDRPAYQILLRNLSAQKAAEAALRSYQTALVAHVTDAIIATTVDGVVRRWNPAAEAIYSRPAAEVIAIPVGEAVGAPLDPAAIVADGGIVHAAHCTADGSPLNVRVSVTAILDGYVLVISDQSALRRAEQQVQSILHSLEQGVMVVRRDGRLDYANPTARQYFGIRAEDIGTLHLPLDVPIYDVEGNVIPIDERPAAQAMRTGVPFTGNVHGVDQADGRRVWLLGSSRLLNPDDPQHSALLISFTDVTAQQTVRQRLAHQATHDSLTGLPNRPHVIDRVTKALESDCTPLAAVLFIDLDNLKIINDSLGHDTGDEVLRIAAQRLAHAVRSDDLVARLGGDEFVAALVGSVTRPDIDDLTARLHAVLGEPIDIDGVTLRVGASIGIVVVDSHERRGAAEILRDADIAMYEAKNTGRGRCHYFTDDLRDRVRVRLTDDNQVDWA